MIRLNACILCGPLSDAFRKLFRKSSSGIGARTSAHRRARARAWSHSPTHLLDGVDGVYGESTCSGERKLFVILNSRCFTSANRSRCLECFFCCYRINDRMMKATNPPFSHTWTHTRQCPVALCFSRQATFPTRKRTWALSWAALGWATKHSKMWLSRLSHHRLLALSHVQIILRHQTGTLNRSYFVCFSFSIAYF